MISKLLFALIIFIPVYAMGAPGGDPHAIPWTTIGVQTFNFLLLSSLLVYLLKGAVVAHFKDRKKSYSELVTKAEAAKKEAEANHREIAARLSTLEMAGKENATKAQNEANELKARLLKEAEEISEKLRNDARKTAEIEIEKAKTEIQAFALEQAIETAQEKLSKQASTDDQTRLQSEFIRKIQTVTQ